MYKRYSCYFVVLYVMLAIVFINAKLLTDMREYSYRVQKEAVIERISERRINKVYEKTLEQIYGNERTVECLSIHRNYRLNLDEQEMEILCRIVQAEAGGEDVMGKMLVADVIINRVENPRFPDDVEGVVFQHVDGVYQFSPVGNGRINDVVVTEETREAVYAALLEEDISDGALYFISRKYADSDGLSWFENNLTSVTQHGGHEFFR